MFVIRVKAIAMNTFREAIRDKILYSLLFFAMLMIGSSILLGRLTLGEYTKIIKDVGLASISLFGTLIAIFVGITLVNKEIDRRTIYTVLAKPIRRWEFILGKYFGLGLTLFVEVLIMTLGFQATLYFVSSSFAPSLFTAIGLIYMELMLLTAFAVLFSSFSTPVLSGLFTLSIFIIGHLTGDIQRYGAESDSRTVQSLSQILYYVLPNLENFNIKNQAVHNVILPSSQLEFAILYGLLYTVVVLGASVAIFHGRDFK